MDSQPDFHLVLSLPQDLCRINARRAPSRQPPREPEDRRIRADPQRQQRDGDRRYDGRRAQRADGEAKILGQVKQAYDPISRPRLGQACV